MLQVLAELINLAVRPGFVGRAHVEEEEGNVEERRRENLEEEEVKG